MNSGQRKRPTAPDNPLVIQPSAWNDLERKLFRLHPDLQLQLRWRTEFYATAARLGMMSTEYVTEDETGQRASLTYTAAKPGLRITMVVAWERFLPSKLTSIFGTVAWGDGPIPVEPEESEGPFVLPLRPLPNSRRFRVSGAPQRVEQVSPQLGPELDDEWCSWMTTLYRSESFTLVRQRYGMFYGSPAPLVARFFKGAVDLELLKRRVEAIGLPERVHFEQLPHWQVDSRLLRRFVYWSFAVLMLFQVAVLVYMVLR